MEAEQLEEYFIGVDRELRERPLDDLMRRLREMILQSIRDNFTSSASPANESWLPRKIEGDGHPLLMDTGALMQAATGGGAGHVTYLEPRAVAVGVSKDAIPYAGVHQFGFPDRNIPQRAYLGAREEMLDKIGEAIADELLTVF